VLNEHLLACPDARVGTLDDVLEADGWARRRARQCLGLEASSATAEAS
jgi:hypothetical protein